MVKVIDYLGTTRYEGPIEVGTIVRNNGYGSRLMRVVEIIPGGYYQELFHSKWDPIAKKTIILPSTFKQLDKVILESYGLLDRGIIKYPSIPKRIPAYVQPANEHWPTGVYSIGPGMYYETSNAGYTPVTIVSHFLTELQAWKQGCRDKTRAENRKDSYVFRDDQLIQDPKLFMERARNHNHYPHHRDLYVAWRAGFDGLEL